MQTRSRLFEDLARVASGAASTATGLREEVEEMVRQRVQQVLARMDVVPREEFDAVRDMAAKARAEQETLAKRVADLEAKLAQASKPARKPAAKRTSAKSDSADS